MQWTDCNLGAFQSGSETVLGCVTYIIINLFPTTGTLPYPVQGYQFQVDHAGFLPSKTHGSFCLKETEISHQPFTSIILER